MTKCSSWWFTFTGRRGICSLGEGGDVAQTDGAIKSEPKIDRWLQNDAVQVCPERQRPERRHFGQRERHRHDDGVQRQRNERQNYLRRASAGDTARRARGSYDSNIIRSSSCPNTRYVHSGTYSL